MKQNEKLTEAPVLETARLRLRPHKLEDFEDVAAMFETPHSRFVGGPCDRKKTWRGFAADVGQWPLLGFGAWAIEIRDNNQFIGQLGLNKPLHFPEREIGWILFEEFVGHGYALEAARRGHQFAFQTLGWQTAVSYIDPDNARSIALAERLGAKLDSGAPTPDGDPTLVYRHRPVLPPE